jgi:hypothetical protein
MLALAWAGVHRGFVSNTLRSSAPIVLLALLAACAAREPDPELAAVRAIERGSVGSRTVAMALLEGPELESAGRSGNTLSEVLARLVPNLRVSRANRAGTCPRLVLRGIKSVTLSSDPDIYVDGARALDTCILDLLPMASIARVEVYAGGQIPRSEPITPSASGAILIFTRR